MDEYQTREDRKAEDRKLFGAFGNLALIIVGGVVLYLIVKNPYTP